MVKKPKTIEDDGFDAWLNDDHYEASGEAQQHRLEEKDQWLMDTLMEVEEVIDALKDVFDSKMED